MKIRNGFVSNSSSSSFIVWFPKNDNTINNEEEFKQKLIDEWYCENDYPKIVEKKLPEYRQHWADGYGMIFNNVDNNCYEGFDEVVSNMGGKWFEWEDY